jgi:hypothetical protein
MGINKRSQEWGNRKGGYGPGGERNACQRNVGRCYEGTRGWLTFREGHSEDDPLVERYGPHEKWCR